MRLIVAGFLLSFAACGSNPYGHARNYAPTGAEAAALEGATTPKYLEVAESAPEWEGQRIAWFGIVQRVESRSASSVVATLAYHELRPRNLCRDETEGSCRVTVSNKSFGEFRVEIPLESDEVSGSKRLSTGSLVRVVGRVKSGESVEILHEWHRHWPFRYYVQTGVSSTMRQ